MNLKSTTTNGFNFRIINSLMKSWGVRLTWVDYKHPPLNRHLLPLSSTWVPEVFSHAMCDKELPQLQANTSSAIGQRHKWQRLN